MARKVVYGRRPNKASAFAVSSVFLNSSPAKTSWPSTPTSSKSQHGSIEEAAIAFGKLKIRSNGENEEKIETKETKPAKLRRALGIRDGNSRTLTKTRAVLERRLESTKDDLKTQKKQESRLAHTVQHAVPLSQVQDILPMLHAVRPDATCDPYIAPLVSLTNEQTIPIPFEAWSHSLSPYFRISKIAEASYGEVYRLTLLAPHSQFTSADESVLKILALKPDPRTEKAAKKRSRAQEKREETMSEIACVESEVKLLKRMTEVPGFTNYRALHVLKGRPSDSFNDAWKEWNVSREWGKKSQFPDPSKKPSYSDDTLWAVIEMQDAGTDIEKMQEEEKLTSVFEVWDVFWQVAIAVGKGEEEARFEHRDLHAGNICVRSRRQNPRGKDEDNSKRKLGFTDLETTIIDYTLSRAEMSSPNPTSSSSASNNSGRSSLDSEDESLEVAYLDLSSSCQDQIFQGNASNDYQYEIYRRMRSALYFSDPFHPFEELKAEAEESGRTWKGFHPQTNLVWLHFVLFKLLEGLEVREEEKDETSLYLESLLRKVEEMLALQAIPREGLMSARDLVAVALAEGWLDDENVRCTT